MNSTQNIRRLGLTAVVCAAATLGLAQQANAGAIYSAVSAVINSGGPGFGTLTETFNQAGLSAGYTSGVTDFNTYIASSPTHTSTFGGFEWFSNQGSSSASVTYNLGTVRSLDGMALWNEESSGIGLLDLLVSTDGVTFSALLSALSPTDNTGIGSYGADVFGFGAVSAQFVRLDMSRCPQPATTIQFNACAIGEVAFRAADGNAVPEPGALALVGLALAAAAVTRRTVKTQAKA